jgi:hypothetical protein
MRDRLDRPDRLDRHSLTMLLNVCFVEVISALQMKLLNYLNHSQPTEFDYLRLGK